MFIREFRHAGLLALIGFSAALTVAASAAPQDHLSRKDQHFMTQAVEGDLSEVKMGQLAQQKGATDSVKQFGKTLEQDHSQHLKEAQQIASQDGISVPSEPSKKQQSTYEKLSQLSGDKFDSAFARDMVKDHKKDISQYRQEAKSGSPLAKFAEQTVPVLEKHLQMAESLTSQRKGK
jgi:putative membrane protein